jgi:PAS domain S-box-containing protein
VYRIFGLDHRTFGATYEAFLAVVHPDDRAAVDEAYTGSLREGKDTYEIEHRIIRKNTGEIRFVHEKCEHIRDRTGTVVTSIGMVHDITDRKKAESAIRETTEHYFAIINNAPLGIFQSTVEGKSLFVNSVFARMLGYDSPRDLMETINRSSVAEVLYEMPDLRRDFVDRAMGSNTWVFFENRYKRKDGSILSANLMFRARKNLVSGKWEVEGFVEDLTDKLASERFLWVSDAQGRFTLPGDLSQLSGEAGKAPGYSTDSPPASGE